METYHAKIRLTAAVMLGVLLSVAPAGATEYYVSPTGSDASAGTSPAEPFRSIDAAARAARAGDVVTILPGVYEGRIRPSGSGTLEAPIVYRNAGGGEVVITTSEATDGGPWTERFAFRLGAGNNHTVLEGLTFRDAEGWIYVGEYAHHTTIRDCTFDGSRMYHGIYVDSGSWTRIENCRFLRAIAYPPGWTPDDPEPTLADYISIWRDSHHNLIDNCQFHEISHVAVCIMGHDPESVASKNIVRRCTFVEPRWKCVSFHSAADTLVEGCRMRGLAASYLQYQGASAIVRRNVFVGYRPVRSEPHPAYFHGVLWLRSSVSEYGAMDLAQHGRIYHNTFIDCAVPVTYRGEGAVLPVVDNVFKNNLFHRFTTPLRLPKPFYRNFTVQEANPFVGNLLSDGPADGTVFELIARGEAAGDRLGLDEAVAASGELCRRQVFIANRQGEAVFVDDAGGDYRPGAGSPAIDAGIDLTRTVDAGRGTEVVVEDARYFCDGYGLIPGDRIVIGDNAPVRILDVDVAMRCLRVDRAVTWHKGDGVNLVYTGTAPDIGALEYEGR